MNRMVIFQWQGKVFAFITAQKLKFTIKDFFSKSDQIRRKLRFLYSVTCHIKQK